MKKKQSLAKRVVKLTQELTQARSRIAFLEKVVDVWKKRAINRKA